MEQYFITLVHSHHYFPEVRNVKSQTACLYESQDSLFIGSGISSVTHSLTILYKWLFQFHGYPYISSVLFSTFGLIVRIISLYDCGLMKPVHRPQTHIFAKLTLIYETPLI